MRRARSLAAGAIVAILLTAAATRPPVPPRSLSVTLPEDTALYPDGPHVDIVDQNCTACHSASMVTTQPPLSRDQWSGEVAKMRAIYKAPIADADVPAILEYLSALSARTPGAAAAHVPDPMPGMPPR